MSSRRRFRSLWRLPFKPGSSSGYNLVVLVMMITVMNAMVAMALPRWSQIIQRDKEEELIFRGLQYAEAIRVFQVRFQRLPTRIEELIETEPRSIRQLYPNPMTEDGRWGLILGGQGQRGGNRQNNNRQNNRQQGDGPVGGPRQQRGVTAETGPLVRGLEGEDRQQQNVTVGPIVGVFSPEGDTSIKIWNNSSSITDWQFRVEVLAGVQLVPGAQSQPRPINAGQLGRPFPPGVTPPSIPGRAQRGQPVGGPNNPSPIDPNGPNGRNGGGSETPASPIDPGRDLGGSTGG